MLKTRNLFMLVVLSGVFIAWAAWMQKLPPKPATALIGTKIFPGLPINQIHKIMLTTTSNTLTLAKVKGIWIVANRFNYPANFDKIADSLLQLGEIKIGQVMTAAESQKSAFNLLDPGALSADCKEQAGTRLELRDVNDGLLATLLIGKPFMRTSLESGIHADFLAGEYPDGRYVQTANGYICLVGQTLEYLDPDAKNWLAKVFLTVTPNDIQNITITALNRAPITLARQKNGDAFALEGLKQTEGLLDIAKVNQISGALNNLEFDDIASPSLSANETGLEHPLVFKAQTRQGQIYTLHIGNTLTNDTFDRYVRVTVDWKAPAETQANAKDSVAQPVTGTNTADTVKINQQQADETKAMNDRLSGWTFILKSYRVEPLMIKRTELIKKHESPKPNTGGQAIDTNTEGEN